MSTGNSINITNSTVSGPISFVPGDHSVAQAGSAHTAHVDHRQGADLAALSPLLQELTQEIGRLTSVKAYDELTQHLQVVQTEVAKDEEPDAGKIEFALKAMKKGAEGLEDGGKIITILNKAYNVAAPLFGFPPLPLP